MPAAAGTGKNHVVCVVMEVLHDRQFVASDNDLIGCAVDGSIKKSPHATQHNQTSRHEH
jgi:hypothetical protein